MKPPLEQTWWVRPEKYCQDIVWRKAEDSPREDTWGENESNVPELLELDGRADK